MLTVSQHNMLFLDLWAAGVGLGAASHPWPIGLCLCCRMSRSHRIRPSHSSRYHRSTMSTGLCIAFGVVTASAPRPSLLGGGCCRFFFKCPVREANARKASPGKTPARGAGEISRCPPCPSAAEVRFIDYPRRGVSVRESPELPISRKLT